MLEGIITNKTHIKYLNKLGINNIDDLINYYPFRYEQINISDLNNIKDNKIYISGIVEKVASVFRIKRNLNKMTFTINSNNRIIKVIIFNRMFLKKSIEIGKYIFLGGKYDSVKNTFVASDISFEKIEDGTIKPVYRTTTGLSKEVLNKYILEALKIKLDIEEDLPQFILDEYKLMDKDDSIRNIHNPNSIDLYKKASIRLKYEELFIFMLKVNALKEMYKDNNIGLIRNVGYEEVAEFINNLPFKLTKDQIKAVDDIYKDLTLPKRMNRLLQGDVGSGKTIVSFIALYINYLSGYQGCIMAPTEILAIQHFNNIKELLKEYNINIDLLTGSTKNKKDLYKRLEEGKIDILIGTHALIQDKVIYKNLGLVITDEQHRFGVNQRSNLKNKGTMADVLFMSATPIPRTYALTIYGDMEISNIYTKPEGRKDITTILKNNKEIIDVLNMINEELKLGHQIYVVSPLIEEGETDNDDKSAKLLYEKFKIAFKNKNIGLLHGKLDNKEKDEVMDSFKEGNIDILISTTVIEVGVDVKNASMIVIFDAHRFGLSTLHQLRGRVGRSDIDSYCILISNYEKDRLKLLTTTNDGFKISEEDFLMRGSGDLFGIRQSGDMSFRLADLKKDMKILLQAKEDSNKYLNLRKNNKIEINTQLEKMLESIGNLD